MFIYEVIDALDAAKIKHSIIGGYALALHGIVRATMDVDIILQLNMKSFVGAEIALNKIQLQSRLPIRAQDVIKMRKEYIENRNLLAWSFVDFQNPLRQVDILITKDLGKIKTQKIKIGPRTLTVATLEELQKMKMEAGRPQDLVDVERIKEKLNGSKKKY
jgi:hypothetical protein